MLAVKYVSLFSDSLSRTEVMSEMHAFFHSFFSRAIFLSFWSDNAAPFSTLSDSPTKLFKFEACQIQVSQSLFDITNA